MAQDIGTNAIQDSLEFGSNHVGFSCEQTGIIDFAKKEKVLLGLAKAKRAQAIQELLDELPKLQRMSEEIESVQHLLEQMIQRHMKAIEGLSPIAKELLQGEEWDLDGWRFWMEGNRLMLRKRNDLRVESVDLEHG